MTDKITILYVDDEPTNLILFEMNFSKHYTVITASNGEEGLLRLNENADINIVISDMRMPGMTGLEFINIAQYKFPNIVYYILTGFDITPAISAAIENKVVNKYFRKPFNPKEISKAISAALDAY